MKRILTLLVITTALSLGVYAQQPLTQFLLVEVLDNNMGASLRDDEDIARRLRRIGFKVSTYDLPLDSEYFRLPLSNITVPSSIYPISISLCQCQLTKFSVTSSL